jgi:hypothetical protein
MSELGRSSLQGKMSKRLFARSQKALARPSRARTAKALSLGSSGPQVGRCESVYFCDLFLSMRPSEGVITE